MATVSGGESLSAHMAAMREKIMNASEVRVGFLEGATYPDGTPVAEVAALQNFGAPAAGIPARAFFSQMVAEKSPEWGAKFAAVLKAADYDADKALALMGEGIAGQLRQAIVDMNSPANSAATNLLKQRFPNREGMTFGDVVQAFRDAAAGQAAPAGKPLVWTGHMLNSVDKEVE
jgi:hypothetical protein